MVIWPLLVNWDQRLATSEDCHSALSSPARCWPREHTEQACSLCPSSTASVKEASVRCLPLDLLSGFGPQRTLGFSLDDLQRISDTPNGRCSGGTTVPEMARTAQCSFLSPENEKSPHFPVKPRINAERCLHWPRRRRLNPPGFLGPGLSSSLGPSCLRMVGARTGSPVFEA